MRPDRRASAEEWLVRAERDLIHAEQSLGNAIVINEAITFHAQQAAEKAVKGYLTAAGQTFTKTHNVLQLVTAASLIDGRFARHFGHAQALTPYAVAFRYPDLEGEPSDLETRAAVRMAREIVAFVRQALAAAQ